VTEQDHYGDADHRYSADIQARICAAMIHDTCNFIQYQDVIRPEYFENDALADITRIVLAFYAKYSRLPKGDELGQGVIDLLYTDQRKPEGPYLEALEQVMTLGSDGELFDFARDKAIEFAKHQAMKNFIYESVELLKKRKYGKIDEKCRAALSVGEATADLGTDIIEDRFKRWELRENEGDRRALAIHTGLERLDQALYGGISRSEMGIIMAYTKVGKTTVSVNFAVSAAEQGKNVAHIIMEDTLNSVSASYDSCISGVPWDELKDRKSEVDAQWELWLAKHTHGRLKAQHYPAEVCSARTIEAYLQQLRLTSNFIPDLVIIDYLTLMVPSDLSIARELKISSFPRYLGAISKEILSLTQRYGYATWLLHQSRSIDESQWENPADVATDKRRRQPPGKRLLRMSHSSDSSEPMKDAHIVLTLNQDDDEYENGVIRIHVAGGRRMPSKRTLTFGVKRDRAQLYDPEKEVKT